MTDAQSRIAELEEQLARAREALAPPTAPPQRAAPEPATPSNMEELFYAAFVARLRAEAPEIIRLMVVQPEIELHVHRPVRIVDGDSVKGRALHLISEGFLAEPKTNQEMTRELCRTGSKVSAGNCHNVLHALMAERIVTQEAGTGKSGPLYRSTDVKITTVEQPAQERAA